jgi:hypothetical protein
MKTNSLLLFALACGLTASAQQMVPEPEPANLDGPVILSRVAPLASLESQLAGAAFDQRGALATAFDEANLSLDGRAAALRAQGLTAADAAEANLDEARNQARQAFRDLSLTTEETWKAARHNAMSAVRKIRECLEVLDRTATKSI